MKTKVELLIDLLMNNPNRLFSNTELSRLLKCYTNDRISSFVYRARKKGFHIDNVNDKGYMLGAKTRDWLNNI